MSNLRNITDKVNSAIIHNINKWRKKDGKKPLPVNKIGWYKRLQRFVKRYGGPQNQKIALEILGGEITYYVADKLNNMHHSKAQPYLRYFTGAGTGRKNSLNQKIEDFLHWLEYENVAYEGIDQYMEFTKNNRINAKGVRPR